MGSSDLGFRLPLAEVIDQHVPHRSALDAVAGFVGRNRVTRLISGFVITAVLIVAYVFGNYSYWTSLAPAFAEQSPPAGGVSVVIVLQKVSADGRTLPAQVVLFTAPDLLDASGLLTRGIEVRVEPAVSGQALTFPAGEPPAPQGIVLPAPCVVQQYPFDWYAVSATVRANALPADTSDAIATEASLFFRIPGWSDQDTASAAGRSPDKSPGIAADRAT